MTVVDLPKEAVLDASLAASFYAKYEPLEILGTGASSTVRRCLCKETKEQFAVKILDLNSGLDTDDVLREECMREVAILKLVSGHPNIIQLIDVFEGDAYVFLVFELCTGGELFDYLTRMVVLSEKRTRMIMRQMILAVQFIHDKGIVHRDLKPENILLDENMNIKLTDFGLAVFETDQIELQETRGTPGYLAPEVLRCGYYDEEPPYGKPVDVWACGVIMYTLLAGFPPFWHRKEYLMLRQIMQGRFTFPSPEWDEISESTKDCVRQMLTVDAKLRVKSHDALSLEFFQQGIVLPTTILFNAKRRFRAACIAISFIRILQKLKTCGTCLPITQLITDPYSNKRLRKLIDALAFEIYGHWIKKSDDQNRAVLYGNTACRELIPQISETNTIGNEDTLENECDFRNDNYDDFIKEESTKTVHY